MMCTRLAMLLLLFLSTLIPERMVVWLNMTSALLVLGRIQNTLLSFGRAKVGDTWTMLVLRNEGCFVLSLAFANRPES